MVEVTRMLEQSPRRMFPSRAPTASRSPTHPNISRRQSAAQLSRKQSTAAMTSNHQRNRHHRVLSYQALIEPRTSISFDTSSHSNNHPRRGSGAANRRLSYEAIKPADRRQSFDRQTLRPSRSSLETKVVRGLRRESMDETGPRLQRSTSGLGFDDSTTEIMSSRD